MIITGIPSKERVVLNRKDSVGQHFYITQCVGGDGYNIYKTEDNKAIKIGKGETPPKLEEKYIK